ncbi:TPA: hypothetical protein ACUB6L_002430, partial [Raoultella ornithinolytica]
SHVKSPDSFVDNILLCHFIPLPERGNGTMVVLGDRILTEASEFHKRFNTAFTLLFVRTKLHFVIGCTLSRFYWLHLVKLLTDA